MGSKSTEASSEIDTWSVRSYIIAAKDLCYPDYVIAKLKKAKTPEEATRIMTTAREHDINEKRGWMK